MKNISLTLFALLITIVSFAQSPQMINYQGVARDLSGNPLSNQNISLRISILSGSPTGTNEYSETHSVTTNNLGLFTIQIGNGSVLLGNFSTIDWGGNSHYLQTEMDENGGTSYTLTGTTQMVSVPYALYAEKAGNGSKWSDNSTGIFYKERGVVIGDSNSIDTSNVNTTLRVFNNKGNSYVDFSGLGNGYPRIDLVGDTAIGKPMASMYLFDFINGEPTLRMGFPQSGGSARHFSFRSNGSNHLIIAGNGNIGLSTGVALPSSRLHVKGGDVYVDNIASGVILKSPNGNCWRVTVDNTGNLIRTAITCP